MANKARVHVELRHVVHDPSNEERDIAFRRLLTAFKKAHSDANIAQCCKQHETYESKSRKRRRKRREAELARLKTKLKENFISGKPQGKGKPSKGNWRKKENGK